MMTLKLGLIALLIGSSSSYAPINMDNINKPVDYPTQQIEVVETGEISYLNNYELLMMLETSYIDENEAVKENIEEPLKEAEVSDISENTAQEQKPPVVINQDKSYEQCVKEAFERLYEEINRMLDEIVRKAEEQYTQ